MPSSFPLSDERPVEEHPSWEPRERSEVERDSNGIRTRDKALGETLAWVVDTLLQDESDIKKAEQLKLQKREALESLSYVRDVLMTNTMELEEDRLIGGEEKKRRQLKEQKEHDDRQAATAAALLSVPQPAPVSDSRLKHSASTQQIRRKPPLTSPTRSSFHTPSTVAWGKNAEQATWSHSRSSFATPTSAVPAAVMPRPPPPTSTRYRRDPKNKSDQTPTRNEEYLDPLGALR